MDTENLILDTEGELVFYRPEGGSSTSRSGPGSKGKGAFYNMAMEENRTISVLMLKLFFDRLSKMGKPKILDAMSATGVRGLRFAVESLQGCSAKLILNDINSSSVTLIRKNVKLAKERHDLSGLDITVLNEDANDLAGKYGGFDFIDLDPYGTPAPFLNNLISSLRPGGILGITATDTAALFGTYPRVCRRRYMSIVHRSPFNYEAGVRALMGMVIRLGGMLEIALEPLLAFYKGHYIRVYFVRRKGVKFIDRSLSMLGYYLYNRENGTISLLSGDSDGAFTELIGDTGSRIVDGPLWHGPLGKREVGEKLSLLANGPVYDHIRPFLEMVAEDQEAGPYFYRTDELSKVFHTPAPKLDVLISYLQSAGYKAARTHFHPMGIKTEAPLDIIQGAFE